MTGGTSPQWDHRRSRFADWPLLLALVVLWLCLWGSIAPLTILTGVLTAVVVVRVFELPRLPLSGRVNVVWSAVFLARFLLDLVLASVQVAAQAFRSAGPGGAPRSGLIAVRLRTHDDLLLTLTAVAVSLVPGSIVVDIDRAGSTLYLHVLGARGPEALDRARHGVLATERRLVKAIGSRADLAARRMTTSTVLVVLVGALLSVAVGLVLYRLVRGPTILDRMIASDVLLTTVIIVLGCEMVVNRHVDTIPVLLVLAATASFGTIAVARSVSKHDRDDAERDPEAASEPLATTDDAEGVVRRAQREGGAS